MRHHIGIGDNHSLFLFFLIVFFQISISSQTKVYFYSDSKYYPYEFLDFDGKPSGFNVELLRKIAELKNLDLEIVLGEWPKQYTHMLEKQSSQRIIMDLYFNKEREKIFDFSVPLGIVYDVIYAPKGSNINSLPNLRSKRVAVQEKSAVSVYLRDNFTNIHLRPVKSEYDALLCLSQNKCDAAIVNEKVGQYIIEQFDFSSIEATSYPINPKEYAFAVQKGDEELIALINDGIKKLKSSGQYSQIYRKWFGPADVEEIPIKDVLLYGGLILLVIALTILMIMFQNQSLKKSVQDISSIQRRTSNELKYQSTFTSYMLSNAPIGIVVTNAKSKIMEVNEYFEDLFGYTKYEAIGKDLGNLIAHDTNEQDTARLLLELDNKEFIRKETKRRHKDGRLLDVELLKFPLIIENEKKGLFCFYIDIRERKILEREIIKARDRAEKLSEFKSEFLAQMSHEIRTPLNVIVGYLSILEYDNDDIDMEKREIVEAMKDASMRIIRTIEMMLNYSEVRNGIYEPEPRRIHLWTDIIEKIILELKPAAEEKHIHIVLNNKAKHDDLYADTHSVSKIFEQIIDNAVKYTREDGFVRITMDENDEEIISEISDTGIGITEEYLGKIFEPFSQEQQGYTRSYDGNGLGLALVKKYCEINNAVIKVQSSKGKGTSFKVIFRKKEVPA